MFRVLNPAGPVMLVRCDTSETARMTNKHLEVLTCAGNKGLFTRQIAATLLAFSKCAANSTADGSGANRGQMLGKASRVALPERDR